MKQDYIRAGVASETDSNLILTGSYDQTVKLWDRRMSGCAMTMTHGAPVDSVLLYPGNGLAVSAGIDFVLH